MLGVIACEDLRDLVLVGHSYGGMVATGVADRVPEGTVRHLGYVDAFVPEHGRNLASYTGGEARFTGAIEGWLLPPDAPAADTPMEDVAFAAARRRHQPAETFRQKLHLARPGPPPWGRTYIHCTRKEPGQDAFAQFAEALRHDPAWRYRTLDASHSPDITAPEALTDLLLQAAG